MDDLLVYGSYGYTGRLVVEEALDRGLEPVVSGRDEARVRDLARETGLTGRVFDLDRSKTDTARILADYDALLNCAGPFVETAEPLVDACIEAGTEYLDVTGEIPVFTRIRERGEEARRKGVSLLPGVGFEVAPSDCLAVDLAGRLAAPQRLRVAVSSAGSLSGGTLHTAIRLAGEGGVIRRRGDLVRVRPAHDTRRFDLGSGPTLTVAVPLGDVVTAHESTGIDEIETYVDLPAPVVHGMRLGRPIASVLAFEPLQRLLGWTVSEAITGPGETELETGRTTVYAEVTGEQGRTVSARFGLPHVYALTATTAVEAVERVLDGEAPAGFQTPASAFGPAFVRDLDDVAYEGPHESTADE